MGVQRSMAWGLVRRNRIWLSRLRCDEGSGLTFVSIFTRIYAILALLSNQHLTTGGGACELTIIISCIVAVMNDVLSYYIIKWLDNNDDDNR
jgi:hypothetical protein